MRKKSNNYGHKKRYDGGHRSGGHHSGGGHHNNRGPRRNWNASREKYLAQARDALSSGDRVQAENYFQHAEHCWRMMVEEGQVRTPRPASENDGSNRDMARESDDSGNSGNSGEDESDSGNSTQLPAFITSGHGQPQAAAAPVVQDWEERDAE